ncbi:MAG: acyl-CoA thioesterase [Sedimentisphaerales bacterium]|nr:acyl-CoA thioesterase [Sedimentisphaerales bacterium]
MPNSNRKPVIDAGTPKVKFPKALTVKSHTITIIPRYCETDQAGVVHHSVYPVWFEMGRTELLRENGMAYKDIEKAGVFFVVAQLNIKYRRPAEYDEELELETVCSKVTASRIEHTYKLARCSDGTLLTEGSSLLACVNRQGKIRRIPEFMYPQSQSSVESQR